MGEISRPKNIEEYKRWLNENIGADVDDRTRVYYDSVASKIKTQFETSDIWQGLVRDLDNFDLEYYSKTGYHLLANEFSRELQIKSFDSFFDKTYRKNVKENKNWPNERNGGWVSPDNWFSKVNDIVRTRLVVKYLDGVEYLIKKIEDKCGSTGINCNTYWEAREEGYYAAHLYIVQSIEIPKPTWDSEIIDVKIELQITTQIQEVIVKLIHKYYEERRGRDEKERYIWQWDYKSDEFISNYIGHILHYVEGMIMEIRERQKVITN